MSAVQCLGARVFWSLDAEAVKYDHKSSFRNLISTWLHVETSPCQRFVA